AATSCGGSRCVDRQRTARTWLRSSGRWVIKAGMESRIILGIGSGRCGTRSLADVLERQPGCRVTHEERPLLAWDADQKGERLRARFARWRQLRSEPIVGDVASFYLPYLDEALS